MTNSVFYSSSSEGQAPGLDARRIAWEVLQAVAAGAYADSALDRSLRKQNLNPQDRALVQELAYGSIRQRYLLDCWLDSLGKIPAKKQPPLLRWLLHLGLYQIFFMKRIPCSAAVNTSVQLAKSGKLAKLAPVVNGLLRAAIRAQDSGEGLVAPNDVEARLAQTYSLPLWLTDKLLRWRGEAGAEDFARASNKPPKLDLRVNRLRTNVEDLREAFSSKGFETFLIDGCPDGLQIASGSGDVRSWPGYSEGFWCLQDRSAQWVAPLLDLQPGDRVLDACAAPGGKTTHIAELLGNRGEVWGVDRSQSRLNRMKINAERLRANCINALVADATKILNLKPSWYKYFQRILLDAPCSGLGTLARHPDARWRMEPSQIKDLVALQGILLESVLPLLSPGGRLVYSTCTIHPDENFSQIKKFLEGHPELKLGKEEQRWPDPEKSGDGFYVAILDLI